MAAVVYQELRMRSLNKGAQSPSSEPDSNRRTELDTVVLRGTIHSVVGPDMLFDACMEVKWE